ncbi:MAG: CDP-alcohol phosphatidyltransferase family protein [Patescibacteria group bacterium]|nr:CDP-alcohol phosphatidyltransferase family protein [Patescibacteria group bacterium]
MFLNKKIIKIRDVEFKDPNAIDRVLDKFFLFTIPKFVTPNHLTIIRYITVPIVFFLLIYQYYFLGLLLFIFSAFTDALDGALARTRKQITNWGKIHDPLADKLLIGFSGVVVISKYIGVEVIILIIILEILTIIIALSLYDKNNNLGAKLPGKIKMIFQSLGVGSLLVYAVQSTSLILLTATILLYISIFFSVFNLFFCLLVSRSI